jgi:cytochrome c biogenesis protein CcmG/thiol:disulfide interchange protein DsbE
VLVLVALALAGLIPAACGEEGPNGAPASAGAVDPPKLTRGRDLPPPLAANLKQANELIDGGEDALRAELSQLEGHPIVVNQWGSWCPPCRAEFPFFAQSAKAHLDEVAFLGVDIQDDREAAEQFLAEFPVPYPSVFDPDTAAVRSLEWTGVSPTTWLIDERGEVVFMRPGAYPDRDQLEADIDRYLLRG